MLGESVYGGRGEVCVGGRWGFCVCVIVSVRMYASTYACVCVSMHVYFYMQLQNVFVSRGGPISLHPRSRLVSNTHTLHAGEKNQFVRQRGFVSGQYLWYFLFSRYHVGSLIIGLLVCGPRRLSPATCSIMYEL